MSLLINDTTQLKANWDKLVQVSATRWQHGCLKCLFDLNIFKNNINVNTLKASEAREKISTDLEYIDFQTFLNVCRTKFKKQSNLT